MMISLRIAGAVVAALYLGTPLAAAQAPAAARTPRTYECAANGHCSVYCIVDGEKQFQTGSPKQVTVTPLARNNYLVEITEQDGRAEFAYLAGTKIVCLLEGVAKKAGE